jgi:lipopolysaccharide/colanic/teichoic acid biosynthesis glycosyltransferase
MRLANRTSRVQATDCGNAADAIVTDDPEVFLLAPAAKRAFDIVAAAVGLALLSPTFLLASIAIKIDSPGPVFRPQMRHGYNNESISALRFRTTTVSWKEKAPTRATRVGGVLRRTGIDSLPQLINVLRGDMSIVGPSSYVAVPNDTFAERIGLIKHRRRMIPGITGWAQVNGSSGADGRATRQRIEFDQYYIENWSFLFDMKIILMTLMSKNTYLS